MGFTFTSYEHDKDTEQFLYPRVSGNISKPNRCQGGTREVQSCYVGIHLENYSS